MNYKQANRGGKITTESNRPGARPGNQNAAKPPGTQRKPKAYRFSKWTLDQVEELAKAKQVTVTEVFERAIDRLYQKEIGTMDSNKLQVQLSRQDLADFMDGNQYWMNQYAAELQRRLIGLGWKANVDIGDALSDKIIADDVDQAREDVDAVMAQMGNEMDDWLQQ